MNNLDRKPFKNDFTGKSAKTKQHFKPNSNLSGYGKGSDVTVKRNKLALPVTRTGSSTGKLVKRTYTDVAPGLQGGLRETVRVLGAIKSFCESNHFGLKNEDGEVIGYVGTVDEARKAVKDGKAYSYFDKVQMNKSIDASNKVQETWNQWPQTKPLAFNDLIVRIRHAKKTGDKAKEALAQDELHRLATRHNKINDPEILDALS
jgi:hypothetical protein